MTEPCTFLPWDTDFFGFRIARVNGNTLDPEKAHSIETWCREQSIRGLYFLASSDDVVTVETAERGGYHQVDIRMTLERPLPLPPAFPALPEGLSIHPALPAEIPALKAIASQSYCVSRFYFDPKFPRQKCDDLYATWIEKSCYGYADIVLVADLRGQTAGFTTARVDRTDRLKGEIGLVGIGPAAQGHGIGQRLVERSLVWFAGQGVKSVVVVTQGRNIRAQRLYQRSGFVTQSIQLWYHKWFEA